MVAMGNMNMPEKSVRQQIASAITIVVQATRMSDGTRKVTSISEITGMEENVISMQEIFTSARKGSDPTARSSALSSQPASVPGSLNGCASRASFCRQPVRARNAGQLRRKGGQQDMGIDHCCVGIPGRVRGRCSADDRRWERADSEAKQVHRHARLGLATETPEDRDADRQSSQERDVQRIPWLNKKLLHFELAPRLQTLLHQADLKWTIGGLLAMRPGCSLVPAYYAGLTGARQHF
jgi:hypothetical protein